MAGRNSTAAHPQAGDRPTVVQLINIAKHFAQVQHEQREQTLAIALAGEAWARQTGTDGEEIDTTSRLIFGTIRELQEDSLNYHALIDSLNELSALVAKSVGKGGAK